MKIKKITLGLGLAFGAFAVVALTSCNGSKQLTYKDDEGKDQTVEVKATNDKDEIANAATALAYSEGDKNFKPTGIEATLTANAKLGGKVDGKAFEYSADASLKAAATIGSNYKAEDIASYEEIKLNAKVPFEAIFAKSTGAKTFDWSKTDNLALEAKSYSDLDASYCKIEKLTLPYDTNETLKSFKSFIDPFVGQLYKVNNADLVNLISGYAPKSVSSITKSVSSIDKDTIQKYLDEYKAMENPMGDLTAALMGSLNVSSQAEFKAKFKELVTTYDLSISSVSGNNISFKLGMKGLAAKEYTGTSYIEVTVDAVKKVPVKLDIDMADYATYMLNGSGKTTTTATTTATGTPTDLSVKAAKVTLAINFNPSVAKLSDADKKDAKDLMTEIGKMPFLS